MAYEHYRKRALCGVGHMPLLHGLLQCALVSLFVCAVTNAAPAEIASVYGGSDGACGSPTANGERVNCYAMTAAHRTMPFGTRITVGHRGCVVVRINDRGPFVSGRIIDVTPAAARQLGMSGVAPVTIERQ